MMKKWIAFLLVLCLFVPVAVCRADGGITWTKEERAKLRVGNPTALRGRFFTSLWGGTTSDLDVQDLLHAYSPVCYDIDLSQFRFDHSVVQDAVAMDDEEGNRTYLLVFYDDLKWSDGTPITASDYAFSILFAMDPVISETGGKAADYSWLMGAEEYLDHTKPALGGVRILSDQMLQIRVKAEALPYFYELSRLMIHPYPIQVIAPDLHVADDGEGAYLTGPLTKELIGETVLDPEKGYLTHPTVVSGPYTLTSYQWPTARFRINPYFKGTEKGDVPRIGELEYTVADNDRMIEELFRGDFGLLNKVTMSENVYQGIMNCADGRYDCKMEGYARTGLTLLWFMESSPKVQELNVRRAIACCFDRDGFAQDYVGAYGMRVDGLYGIGQWMYRLASGQMNTPVDEDLPEEEYQAKVDAFRAITLDGLTQYEMSQGKAARQLDTGGWKVNEKGIRSKTINGETVELRLTLGIPESEDAKAALENRFIQNLESVGIAVTIQPMSMEDLEKAYRGEADSADMLYLGEDFTIFLDPGILAPTEDPGDGSTQNSLTAVKDELYRQAQDMVKTDPFDLLQFMVKWVALQERISETLPLLPVYSNVYFDFYSRELHDYRITRAVTWGEAITKSYISDAEEPGEDEKQSLQEALERINPLPDTE